MDRPMPCFYVHHLSTCRYLLLLLTLVVWSGVGPVKGTFSSARLGVNYGHISSVQLPAGTIVDLVKKNGFDSIKLFDADATMLRALENSGLEVTVAVQNDELIPLAASFNAALSWVRYNVAPWRRLGGVNIKYVAVGNEVFLSTFTNVTEALYPAMVNVQKALEYAGLRDDVKTTTPMNFNILSSSYPPSAGTFDPKLTDKIGPILSLLNSTGAPVTINIYPFFTLSDLSHATPSAVDQAFIDRSLSSPTAASIQDSGSGLRYNSNFEMSLDALVYACRRLGYPDMEVVVGEIGWPSDGDTSGWATVKYAAKANNNVVQFLLSGKGTPLRPHVAVPAFLFGLLDEDQKPITGAMDYERHWGLFQWFGSPKYALSLSAGSVADNGSATPATAATARTLEAACGVYPLTLKWCVAKPNMSEDLLSGTTDYICGYTGMADCSPLDQGSSCYTTNYVTRASYAMNDMYQRRGQQDSVCDFNQSATITTIDPSFGSCNFTRGYLFKDCEAGGSGHRVTTFGIIGIAVASILIAGLAVLSAVAYRQGRQMALLRETGGAIPKSPPLKRPYDSDDDDDDDWTPDTSPRGSPRRSVVPVNGRVGRNAVV